MNVYMKKLQKIVLPVFLATIWISLSEFVRNEFLIKSYWIQHYEQLGMTFPSEPINGAIWGLWSLLLAIALFLLLKKFTWTQGALLGWFMAFVLMWVVVGNMGVLPNRVLPVAIPLSLIEVFGAAYIIEKLT